jgi:hypothetical protein
MRQSMAPPRRGRALPLRRREEVSLQIPRGHRGVLGAVSRALKKCGVDGRSAMVISITDGAPTTATKAGSPCSPPCDMPHSPPTRRAPSPFVLGGTRPRQPGGTSATVSAKPGAVITVAAAPTGRRARCDNAGCLQQPSPDVVGVRLPTGGDVPSAVGAAASRSAAKTHGRSRSPLPPPPLPPDVVWSVLRHLPGEVLAICCAPVCRMWRGVVADDTLWREIVHRHCAVDKQPPSGSPAARSPIWPLVGSDPCSYSWAQRYRDEHLWRRAGLALPPLRGSICRTFCVVEYRCVYWPTIGIHGDHRIRV